MITFNYVGWQAFSKTIPIVLIFLVTAISTPTNADTGTQFTNEVHEFQKLVLKQNDWFSPQSPWFPYLRRQNEEGLSPIQTKQYLIYQAQGQCKELTNLEVAGFSRLHPELAVAMKDNLVKSIFIEKIIPRHSFGFRRCKALALLNPIIEAEKKLDPEFYYLTIPSTNLNAIPKKIYDPREVSLRKAFKVLFDLAACDDHKPAIQDILFYSDLRLNLVGYHQLYYFYHRAQRHGLATPDIEQLAREIRQVELSPRLRKLQKLLSSRDLTASRKLVFRIAYVSCGRGMNE